VIKICYMDENGKAVPCTHPEKECGPQCPEWKKHKALQDRLPEPTEPAKPAKQAEPEPAEPEPTQEEPKTLEKRVQDLETAVDNIIGLAYCNRGNAKCPNRPCIYKIINEMAQYQLSAEETVKLIKNLMEKKAIEIPKTGILIAKWT